MPITPERQAIIDANKKKTAQAGQAVLDARADSGILGTASNATIANNVANRSAEWIGSFKQPTQPSGTSLGTSTVIGPNGSSTGGETGVPQVPTSTGNMYSSVKLDANGNPVNAGGMAANAGVTTGNITGTNTNTSTLNTDTTYTDTTPTYWTMDDLRGKGFTELADYLESSPQDKAIFEQMGKLSEQQVKDFLKTRSEAVQDFNIKRGRTEDSAKAQERLTAIQQNQSIRSMNDQLTRAKNIAGFARFSSSSSPEKNDAVSKGVAEIDKRLNEAVEMYGIINEENAAQVQETLRQMDRDIRQKVGNFLFDKLNELDQSIASGQVATPEQLDNLFKKYSDAIIKEAPILTETGIQQMSNVANAFIGQQKYLANLQQQYTQNAATFTASPAGFYVDGNGMQVIGVDGKPVPVPPKPIWSGVQNGKFISVGQDEFGNLDVQEVAIPGYVAPTEKPNIIETSQGLYNASTGEWIAGPGSSIPGLSSTSVPYTPPTGFESRGAGSSVAVKNTGDGIEIGIPSGTKLEGIGGQCGGLVNDFAKTIPGYTQVGNDYESKLANKNSSEPVAGGLVMWTPGKFEDNGHIGIVEKVFADGSFQIYDTNYVAKNTTSRRIIKPGDKEYDLIQKTGGFFDPSKVGGQKGVNKDLYDLSEYIVNTQARGAGYSNEDVKQFTDAVRKYANSGDEETVYQLYRDRIMSNKEVGPKIFDNQELKSALENVRSTLQAYKESGGDTNVFSNIAEVVANKLGTTTDTQLAKANNQIGVLVADYIRAISGTAASDKEVTRLINSMPKIKNVDSFNTVILDTLEDTADTKMKASIETAMGFKGKKYASKLFPEVYGTQADTSTQITEEDFSSI